jgi:hypothetical protein
VWGNKRRRGHLTRAAMVAVLGLASCGTPLREVSVADVSDQPSSLDQDTPISLHGIGPVVVGMTVAQGQRAAGIPLIVDSFVEFGGFCYFARPEGLEDHVYFLVLAPGDEPVTNPQAGIISAVSAAVGMASPAQTDTGIAIGSTEDEVLAAYPGQVVTEPHHYDPSGHYLTVVPSDPADQSLRIRFSTDGEQVVEIDAGLERATSLVEGCA